MAISHSVSSKTTTSRTAANISKKPLTKKASTATPVAKTTAKLKTPAKKANMPKVSVPKASKRLPAATQKNITAEERYRMIAAAAYLRAEQRGFQGGNALQDWVAAETEIDGMLKRSM